MTHFGMFAYAMIVVGFLPVIVAIAINYMVLARIGPFEKKLSEIGIRLIPAIVRLSTYQQKLSLVGDYDADEVIE